MNMRLPVVLSAACLLAAGCRQDPYLNAHIELLNAERRALEDRVYELEYDCETKAEEIERLKNDRQRPREEPGSAAAKKPERRSPPAAETPLDEDMPELSPPVVEPGIPVEPGSPSSPSPARSSFSEPTSPRDNSLALDLNDPRITHLFIHPQFTGGVDLDQQPGDDGIALVIEPRNREETYVPLAGPVTVVLLDPAEQGERKRVARWDLDAGEVDRQIRNSADQRGIFLTLPWPQDPPQHHQLHLFVRYATVDGRQYEVDREIRIVPPGQLSRRWAPRTAPRAPDAFQEHRIEIARPEWTPFR